jgi:hypothetical protein
MCGRQSTHERVPTEAETEARFEVDKSTADKGIWQRCLIGEPYVKVVVGGHIRRGIGRKCLNENKDFMMTGKTFTPTLLSYLANVIFTVRFLNIPQLPK